MFSLIYDFCICLYLLLNLPKLFTKKPSIKKRFLKKIKIPKNKKIILFHCVSLGETKVIKNLILKFLEKKNCFVIISSITKTGHMEAIKIISEEQCLFLPFDFSFFMKRFIKKINPNIIIISETDFWYHFLKFAKKQNAKIILVNGKISQNSYKNFKRFSFFAKKIFSLIDFFYVQNKTYAKRFENLKINKEKIIITGNLKLENRPPILSQEKLFSLFKIFNLKKEDKIITIASTHENEEKKILDSIDTTKYKIFLVPRHPERFLKVEKLLKSKNLKFCKYSNISNLKDENIILIDTMGFLNTCYQLSDIAIVGGSFLNIGGHNILEPIFFNTPVFFGPHMQEQEDLKSLILKFNAGKQVKIKNLSDEIIKFFKNKKILINNCEIVKKNLPSPLKKIIISLNIFFLNC